MKKSGFRIVVVVLLAVFFLVFFFHLPPKSYIFRYVKSHRAQLEAFADRLISNRVRDETHYHSWRVSYSDTTGTVEFITGGYGLVPSTVYQGFYYSPKDERIGFQGTKVAFTEHNRGWIWKDTRGDNWEYIEKIIDHWYWFEMHF